MGSKSRMYCVYKKIDELSRLDLMEKYNVSESALKKSDCDDMPFGDLIFKPKNKKNPMKIKYVYQLYDNDEFVEEGTERYLANKYNWVMNYLCNCYQKGINAGKYTLSRRLLTNDDLENGNLDKWIL